MSAASPTQLSPSEADSLSNLPPSLPLPLAVPLFSYSFWLSAQLRAEPSPQLREFLQEPTPGKPSPLSHIFFRQSACPAAGGEADALDPPSAQQELTPSQPSPLSHIFFRRDCPAAGGESDALIPPRAQAFYGPRLGCSRNSHILEIEAASSGSTDFLAAVGAEKQASGEAAVPAGKGDARKGGSAQCNVLSPSGDGESSCDSDEQNSEDESSSSDESCSGFSSFGSEDSDESSDSSARAAEPLIGPLSSRDELPRQTDSDSSRPSLTLDDDESFRATWPFGPYRFPPVSPASATESPGERSPNSRGLRVRWCDEEDGGSLVDVCEFERSDVEWDDIRPAPRRRRYQDAEEGDDVCGCFMQ